MTRSAAFGLAAIVIGSIAVRLSPLWSFLYWGSDTGEYFAIAKDLLRTQHISTTYYGWGVTYPYFPGMFFLQGGLVGLGGLDLPTVLNLLVPVLGALAVLPVFLIGHRVSGEASVALFAAAVLAGAIPHVYTTAHPAPATLGDLLALTGLVLFLRLRADGRSMVPLLLVTAALIATHHLSVYFFLLMVFGTILIRGFVAPWRQTYGSRREVAFAGTLLGGTVAYWLGYATAFRDYILPDVSIRP
jgi:asparagine N-glycosylation enzyme membrane subunit Stt3